ncbi:MAG: IS701 family transposase [Deltaproteobacteria bacterium]|nr:IS701 family transposase [Deltaproteobacteria bacterium]
MGVGKQYCGTIGKVENCQVGVFAAYASPHGYALIDKQLFIPEKWFSEDYALRRRKCELPDDITFKTKPQIAVQMLKNIVEKDQIPFKWVLADSIYGNSPDFIETVENLGLRYFVSIPSDTYCWLNTPITRKRKYKYKGQIREKIIVDSTQNEPITVACLAKSINNFFWYRRKVSEGTKGPIEYEFTKRRIVVSKNGVPEKEVWLIMRRTIEKQPSYNYFLSNASVSTRLPTFVWLSGLRWSIEQCFEETKTELGMDHYEVRKYRGWHHHILTCMLAHFFLWHLKIRLGKKAPSITLSQLRTLIEVILPIREYDSETALGVVKWIQARNHRAYLSHRKKKLKSLP